MATALADVLGSDLCHRLRLRIGEDRTLPFPRKLRRMQVLLFLHVVAMAFFLGGQLMLAATVVPVERSNPDPARMRGIAQRFGIGSLIALGVLLFTGMLMASHYELWDLRDFQIKMGLVVALIVSVLAHMQYPKAHALMGLTFVLTLGIVWIGLDLPV